MRSLRRFFVILCIPSCIAVFGNIAIAQDSGGYYPRPSSEANRQFPVQPFQSQQNSVSGVNPPMKPLKRDFAVKAAAAERPAGSSQNATENLPNPAGQAESLATPQAGDLAADTIRNFGTQPSSELIFQGREAFDRSCVSCHDAQRSFGKTKSLAGWRLTVRRMADKSGADVQAQDIDAIANYLASQTVDDSGEETAHSVTIFGTVSPLWRGGNDNLQNSGFFPDAWLGASFQSSKPISGRVTACVSCHTEPGLGSRIELVEAVVRLDLAMLAGCRNPALKASVEAGRIVVPFGAFASQSNPGVYRTVSKPLIYNMGQRVQDGDLGDPVLPMPYSDEGAVLNFGAPIVGDVVASWDLYAVNGLQGGGDGIDFDQSRDYVDNNTTPSTGTRVTVGNQYLKLGGSFMSGEFTPTGGADPSGQKLNYWVYGYDAVLRYNDIFRLQFEYARRNNDRIVAGDVTRDHVDGYYLESELLLHRVHRISLLARYDSQSRVSIAPPPDSILSSGTFTVARFTYGLNVILPGGSLLMVNHERWFLPEGLPRTDVLGVRWACTF
jgi:mono/diheme cytochrome c family protein